MRFKASGLIMAFTCALVLLLILPSGAWALTKPTPTSEPGATMVVFSGHVYYLNGVTPLQGATVTVNYPIGGTPTTATTDSSGYYSVSLPLDTKTVSRSATSGSATSGDITDSFEVTGANPIVSARDLIVPVQAPAILSGYVYRGSEAVSGILVTAANDNWTGSSVLGRTDSYGHYQITIPPEDFSNIHVYARDDNGQTPVYHLTINSGNTVTQDMQYPTQMITYRIRALRNGATVPEIRVRMEYNGICEMPITDNQGVCTWRTGFFGGAQAMRIQAFTDGRFTPLSPEYFFVPGPEYAGGTYNYDLILNSTATPTPTPGPATPTPTATASPVTPTATPRPATPTAGASAPTCTTLPGPTTQTVTATPGPVPGTIGSATANPSTSTATASAEASAKASPTPVASQANPTPIIIESPINPLIYVLAGMGVMAIFGMLIGGAYLLLKRK